MVNESFPIETLEQKIDEFQKKIRMCYAALHNEDLSDEEKIAVGEEINHFKELVFDLQATLREKYKEIFSAKHSRRTVAHQYSNIQ